jgi:hypothetical protein
MTVDFDQTVLVSGAAWWSQSPDVMEVVHPFPRNGLFSKRNAWEIGPSRISALPS